MTVVAETRRIGVNKVRRAAWKGAAVARLSGGRSSWDEGLAGARPSSPQKRWARAKFPESNRRPEEEGGVKEDFAPAEDRADDCDVI